MVGAGRVQIHFLKKIDIRLPGIQDFPDPLHIFYNLFPVSGADHFSPVHEEIHGPVKTCEADVPGKEPEGILPGKCLSAFRNRERRLFFGTVFPERIPENSSKDQTSPQAPCF